MIPSFFPLPYTYKASILAFLPSTATAKLGLLLHPPIFTIVPTSSPSSHDLRTGSRRSSAAVCFYSLRFFRGTCSF
ncbi:hypothetical protein V8C35DRAFT_309269 [Trichoderma chlorosporum]